MKPRADFLTVATTDLDAAHEFYVDGLGWEPLLTVPGEILFFQIGHGLVLGFFDAGAFANDLGAAGAQSAVSGFTLSHNVDDPASVTTTFEAALAAGGTAVKAPVNADSAASMPTSSIPTA